MTDMLTGLIQRIDENAGRYSRLDMYYRGNSPLTFLSPEAREALGERFGVMGSNLCRLAVTSLAERLRVTGFTLDGSPAEQLWADWIGNDLDQVSSVAHREALVLGSAFVIVWADAEGNPSISVESARQVAVVRDPGTRRIVAGVKRWETGKTTEAVLYEADRITRLRADHLGATGSAMRVVEVLENPLGVPPIVELRNNDRLLDGGVSELTDLMPLQDALNKLLADMMVGSEYYARPRRWASGVELVEEDVLDADGNPTGETVTVNPFPEGNRMMIAEDPGAKFGQLPAADLASYKSAIEVIVSQMQAVSGLPAHYVGVTSNQPPSADALRAAEASLTARAEQRQQVFGRAWEDVAKLAHAVRTGLDAQRLNIRVTWADPATRSLAQEADAVVKLFQTGLLPASYALARLGYSEDEVKAIRTARRAEALDNAGTDLTALVS
jgi:hypothetical protein